jgi:hypothetical protein
MGAAAFLLLLGWICRRAQLSVGATWVVMTAATLGSPGLVALFLMAEDNVLYLPVVLGIYALMDQRDADRHAAIRRGIGLGALLAVAMLINVSLLVMLFALPAGFVLWLWLRDRVRALGLLVAFVSAFVIYYLAHVFPFTHAKIALHEFLPQALRLQDFAAKSNTPLFSLARFEEYRGGLRAIALTPNIHLMNQTSGLRIVLLQILPKVLFVLAALLVGWLIRYRGAALRTVLRTRLDLVGLLAIGLVFPYFYEPALIERWDVFWVGCLFGLVPFFKSRPSRFAIGLVVAMISIQGIGTITTIAHHYGVAWQNPALGRMRLAAREVTEQNRNPVVLAYDVDRLLLADFSFRTGGRVAYLVREDGGEVTCFRLVNLIEQAISVAELQQALQGKSSYIDPALSPNVRRVLGLAP